MKSPPAPEKVNILLVDDQPGKLMSYELILQELGQNLLKAGSAQEALELLLKNDVAVILADVCMPDLDGFELAQMIREHPRFKDTAIIFISAINVSELDSLKGYELGGVDYVPVPVVPGVLRAKVRVFVDLYVKSRELERMNNELEQRVAERTEQLEAAIARQELLAREVDHRARNALAVVQSIVSLTPNNEPAHYVDAIRGRIKAMAMAHNLLSEARWQGADLLKLAREELAPYSGRVEIAGPTVSIAPSVAQSLALALHELATNAAKYGALSDPEGRLCVSWAADGATMRIEWREDGCRRISKPSHNGFGAKVIDASVRAQLGGGIEREWRDSGLLCVLSLPLSLFAQAPPQSAPERPKQEPIDTGALRGRRVLVVEDEPLLALMTSRLVSELGAAVEGPFATMEQARAALSDAIDVAVLDVNLNGRLVYELAAELRERAVPIIFLTGYHAGAIDQNFADAPTLTKPVERDDLAHLLASVISSQTLNPAEAAG